MRPRSSTTTSYATATAKPNSARWNSCHATSSSSLWCSVKWVRSTLYGPTLRFLANAQLVEQNSALKKDVVIAERKLMSRNERIGNLETMLTDAQERLDASEASFEKQLQSVRDRLDQSRGAS